MTRLVLLLLLAGAATGVHVQFSPALLASTQKGKQLNNLSDAAEISDCDSLELALYVALESWLQYAKSMTPRCSRVNNFITL